MIRGVQDQEAQLDDLAPVQARDPGACLGRGSDGPNRTD